jgi:ATP-dependent RNA helicase RhlE
LKINLKLVSIIGGESIGDQLLDIQKGCDIVVATTGRLLDILDKKQLNLSLEFFVLDEADKMLDFGFEEELDLLLKSQIPKNRQNLLFSATYPHKSAKYYFKNYKRSC